MVCADSTRTRTCTSFRPFRINLMVRFNILRHPQQVHAGRIHATLPYDKNPPPYIYQSLNLLLVSRHILVKFLHPATLILSWRGRIPASRMSVPETSMHKYRQVIFGQYNIWTAWQFLVMQPISKSSRMQKSSHQHFWFGIFTSNSSHHARSRICVDYICHSWKPENNPSVLM